MSENEILDEIDKLRRENGWKPRRRLSQQQQQQHQPQQQHQTANHQQQQHHQKIELNIPIKSDGQKAQEQHERNLQAQVRSTKLLVQ